MEKDILYGILILLAIIVIALVWYSRKLRKQVGQLKLERNCSEERNRQMNDRLAEVHRNQLNPHLLKNSLNAILSHAYQTYHTMDNLAQVLDYVLYESADKLVSVEEEINFVKNLIEINKVKLSPLFDMKLRIETDEDDELLREPLLVPLISVDLIENAFKHADFHSPDSYIAILITFRSGVFEVSVSNKISLKSPLKKPRSGIGTKTLEERLLIYYPGRHELKRRVERDSYFADLSIQLYE